MRTPISFPSRAAIAVRIARPATSMPFVFLTRANGSAVTEIMRPASAILIRHNPGDCPVMPRVLLVLTGPSGPSVPHGPGTGKVSGGRMERPGPGPLRPVAAQRRRRAVRAGRGRRSGELHRPVPDGRSRPPLPVVAALEAAIPDAAALVFACLGIALALHGRRALRARALNLASVGDQRVHERDRRGSGLAEPGHLGHAPGRLRPGQRHPDRRRPRLGAATSTAPRWPPTRPPRSPSSAAWPCGCCAWPWPPPPPWPGSAPGCWPSARSPPAAAPRHLASGARAGRARGR